MNVVDLLNLQQSKSHSNHTEVQVIVIHFSADNLRLEDAGSNVCESHRLREPYSRKCTIITLKDHKILKSSPIICLSALSRKGKFLPGVEFSNAQQCQVIVVTLNGLKHWNKSSNETSASVQMVETPAMRGLRSTVKFFYKTQISKYFRAQKLLISTVLVTSIL